MTALPKIIFLQTPLTGLTTNSFIGLPDYIPRGAPLMSSLHRRMYCTFLICLFTLPVFANEFSYPVLKSTGKRLENFIPKGWHELSVATGDLNNDKLPDIAAVIEYGRDLNAKPGEYNSPENVEQPRILFMAFKRQQGGYTLSTQSNDVILCANEGGAFDPFEDGLTIERGAVVIHFYGGRRWRWDITARFRYQNNGWDLIGLTDMSYDNTNGASTTYDYNLLTGKMCVGTCNVYDEKEKGTEKWVTPGKRKVTLKQFRTWSEGEWLKIADHG